jgi:hypothetical protein
MNQGRAYKMLRGAFGTAHWSPDEKTLVFVLEQPILEVWTASLDSLGAGMTPAQHDREAVAHYSQKIEAESQQVTHYLSRASCYVRLNELEKAIADIETADRISTQPEGTARWLAELKAARKAGTSVPRGPLAGSMSYDNATDTYALVGSGIGIADIFDEFHFGHARLSGDGSITARIDSVEHVHDWTRAGVMIRNTLDPTSPHVSIVATPAGNITFQYRMIELGATHSTQDAINSVEFPHWVRLTRKGNRFTAQHSNDGVQWDAVVDPQHPNKPTSIEISMNETVYIGLTVTSHSTTRAAEARISNVRLTGSVNPPGPFVHSKDISFEIPPDNSTNK